MTVTIFADSDDAYILLKWGVHTLKHKRVRRFGYLYQQHGYYQQSVIDSLYLDSQIGPHMHFKNY